ncbi:MAG TPA: 4Fe-4S binding protein [Anaeromyxobacteraceae bacterium]|nr:4Fe-4S binding protein [Anaeromyxobacteraceae bacterium]
MRPRARRFTVWRRAVQASLALLFLALPAWNAAGHRAMAGTLIALRIGPVDLVEPAAALSAALAARGGTIRLLVRAMPLALLALALGPVFCSWMCPWGLVSEGLDRLRHRGGPARSGRRDRPLRAIALGTCLALSLLLGTPVAPLLAGPRLLTSLPLEMVALRSVPAVTGLLLLALLALEILGPRRIFCRALCPAGALAAYLRTPRTLTVITDTDRCRCPDPAPCVASCSWGIDPRRVSRLDGCSGCLACIDVCPTQALSPGFGRSGPGLPGKEETCDRGESARVKVASHSEATCRGERADAGRGAALADAPCGSRCSDSHPPRRSRDLA